MAEIHVLLANEDADKLKQHVYASINDEITKLRADVALEKPILTQVEIAKYLAVSATTIREYEKLSMPYGHIGKRKFYDKEKCRSWILSQQIA